MTLTEVLGRAWQYPFRTKSNFARDHASLIAMAASDGFITTKVATGIYGGQWNITAAGLRHFNSLKGL